MTRAEWLASLQTFDKVWIPPDKTGPGRVVEIVVMGDGTIREARYCGGRDLRQPWRDGTAIQPLPEAPYGRCSGCGTPLRSSGGYRKGCCFRCAQPRAIACIAGCRTKEEHESEVHAQRVRCGLAPGDGEPVQ